MRDVTRKSIFQLFSHNHNEMFMKLEKISLKMILIVQLSFMTLWVSSVLLFFYYSRWGPRRFSVPPGGLVSRAEIQTWKPTFQGRRNILMDSVHSLLMRYLLRTCYFLITYELLNSYLIVT